jgi:hypothetical protein
MCEDYQPVDKVKKSPQSDWKEGSTVTFLDENGKVTDKGIVLKSDPYRLSEQPEKFS